jgi:uncharacterized protein YciI
MTVRTFVSELRTIARPSRELVARHVEYLRALDTRGALVVCGPFVDGEGGMVCFTATDEHEARRIAMDDPFVREGARDCRVRELERATAANDYLSR